MATTLKALARGQFGTSSATIYTVPSATTAVITNISVCNTTGSSVNFYLLLDGQEIFSNTSINAYSTAVIDIKQALGATKLLAGYASSTGVKYHLTGVEIS